MEVHLPKPLHGWREFVGEVGIIVLGVLMRSAPSKWPNISITARSCATRKMR